MNAGRRFAKQALILVGGLRLATRTVIMSLGLLTSTLDAENWGDIVEDAVASDIARQSEMAMLDMTSRDGINLLFKQARMLHSKRAEWTLCSARADWRWPPLLAAAEASTAGTLLLLEPHQSMHPCAPLSSACAGHDFCWRGGEQSFRAGCWRQRFRGVGRAEAKEEVRGARAERECCAPRNSARALFLPIRNELASPPVVRERAAVRSLQGARVSLFFSGAPASALSAPLLSLARRRDRRSYPTAASSTLCPASRVRGPRFAAP